MAAMSEKIKATSAGLDSTDLTSVLVHGPSPKTYINKSSRFNASISPPEEMSNTKNLIGDNTDQVEKLNTLLSTDVLLIAESEGITNISEIDVRPVVNAAKQLTVKLDFSTFEPALHNTDSDDESLVRPSPKLVDAHRCLLCYRTLDCTSFISHVECHKGLRFVCIKCAKAFRSKKLLELHVQLCICMKKKPVKTNESLCHVCGVSTKNLALHAKKHLLPDEKIESCCYVCGKTFLNFFGLNDHLRRLHGIQSQYDVTCDECGRGFVGPLSKRNLEKHIQLKHGSNSKTKKCTKTVKCSLCPRTFHSVMNRDVHKRSHTGETPFKCSYESCGQSFTSRWNLIQHVRLHTGEKPYKCVVPGCDEVFRHNVTRKSHHRKHHKGVPLPEMDPKLVQRLRNWHRPKKSEIFGPSSNIT